MRRIAVEHVISPETHIREIEPCKLFEQWPNLSTLLELGSDLKHGPRPVRRASQYEEHLDRFDVTDCDDQATYVRIQSIH